jgi:3-hydroxyisobutyrate dehydrogenase-like beta-hydroxyacid dehydrogenase
VSLKTIGIMSIGEMGYHWAQLIRRGGGEVLSYDKDRSDVTRERAHNAGVKSVKSLAQLCQECDLIVSIVVPSSAPRVAAKIASAAKKSGRTDLVYLDANAISPMTAEKISAVVSTAGLHFVDGCIIGSAAKMDKGAVVYVSGGQANRLEELRSYGFAIEVLGSAVAQASAFKVVYAGLTKGLQGLFVELLIGARSFGLLDEIMKRYEESFPGLLDKVSGSIVGLRLHARRRAEEMDELKRTFAYHGKKSLMAPATQRVLQSIAALNTGKASATGERDGELLETIELFFEKGLLNSGSTESLNSSGVSDSAV